jgi:YHS domain-containing protein
LDRLQTAEAVLFRKLQPEFSAEVRMTIDPVCGVQVEQIDNEFEAKFAGKKYFFCSEECMRKFEDRPEEYIEIAA